MSSYVTTADDAPASNPPQTPVESPSRRRRTSFSFLSRSKSNDAPIVRATSDGNKLTKRRKSISKEEAAREQQRNANAIPPSPALPRITPPPLGLRNMYSPTTDSQASTYSPPGSSHYPNTRYGRYQMDSINSQYSYIPVPPIPEDRRGPPGSFVTDPLSRSDSITNRGRYSYASSAVSDGTVNSPRRLRRRKDPTPFNVLVVGVKNCGKTSFIEFLRSSLARPVRQRLTGAAASPPPTASGAPEQQGSFNSHYLETELGGERVGLTLWDSKGLERHLVDLQLREMSSFLESKFQDTFNEEQKVLRVTGTLDTHIHCVFLILDPARLDINIAAMSSSAQQTRYGVNPSKPRVTGNLDEDLDVGVLRALQGKTTVVPIISKADTITTAHMTFLKRMVSESLKKVKFDPLEALNIDSDNESEYDTADEASIHSDGVNGDESPTLTNNLKSTDEDVTQKPFKGRENNMLAPSPAPQHDDIRVSTMSDNVDLPLLPMSIISPDVYDPGTIGRRFPWGFADPNNPEHCDFVRLKDTVFGDWRRDLRTASRERWYEGWRTTRLRNRGQNTVPAAKPMTSPPRAVSGAAAYRGTTAPPTVNGNVPHSRVVSNSEIGVAIGGNFAQGQPQEYVKRY